MEKKISSSAKQGVIQLVSFLPCQVEPIRGIYSLQATHEPCTTPRWSPFHEAWWTMVIGSPNKRWRETIDIVNHCMHRTVYRNMVNISSKILLISTSCHFPDAGLHTQFDRGANLVARLSSCSIWQKLPWTEKKLALSELQRSRVKTDGFSPQHWALGKAPTSLYLIRWTESDAHHSCHCLFGLVAEFCLSQVSKCWVKALLWGLWSLTQFKWTRHESDLQKTDVFLPEHSLQPCKRLKPSNASRTCFHRCWITLKTLNKRGDLQKWLSGYEMASFWVSWLWLWRRSTHLFLSFSMTQSASEDWRPPWPGDVFVCKILHASAGKSRKEPLFLGWCFYPMKQIYSAGSTAEIKFQWFTSFAPQFVAFKMETAG